MPGSATNSAEQVLYGTLLPLTFVSALALLTALAGAVMAGHLDSRIRWEKRTSWLSIALVIEAAGAQMTSWIQVLLEFQRDWTQHATYEGARSIAESNGGYGIGLAHARDRIHPG